MVWQALDELPFDQRTAIVLREIHGLSYDEIGTSTLQSRADAAFCDDTLVFVLPGSTGAVTTAMTKIILEQLDIRHRPCNFAELLG